MKMKKSSLSLILMLSGLLISQCIKNLTEEEAFKKGTDYLKAGDTKAAYKYLKKASDKAPDNSFYHWAAAKAAPNRNLAFIHGQAAWDNGLKSFDVLLMLTNLSFRNTKEEKLSYALDLYNELPDSIRNEELRGALFERFNEFDSSIAIWKKIYKTSPTPELCNKIAMAYSKNNQPEKAGDFLQNCRKKKQLNSRGYLLLAYLYIFDYRFDKIDTLFNEARSYGLYTDNLQLEHAGFLILEGKLAAAESLLIPLAEPIPDRKKDTLTLRARILLGYLYRAQKEPEKINALAEKVPPKSSEQLYYSALIKILLDSADALEKLKKARAELPDFPIIDLVYARENARGGNFTEAVNGYKKLPAIFRQSPVILIEYAVALTKAGNDTKALALINTLHRKKKFTKHSLELFRDITYRTKLIKESMAAQKLLEKKYKNDTRVQYTSAMLALQNGKIDKALTILKKLSEKYPDEPAFEIARIKAYLIKKEYNQVIDECRESKLELPVLCPLLAEAYIKLGKPEHAEKVFEKSLKQDEGIELMIAFAQFQTKHERYEKAVVIYEKILNTYKEKLGKDEKGHALMLNNYTWTLQQVPSFNKRKALSSIKTAYELYPENIHILDTYASTLIKSGKYRDCIKLLEERNETAKEPALLMHLATAYDKDGHSNKAVRAYQDILRNADSTAILSGNIDKRTIQDRINRLTAEN